MTATHSSALDTLRAGDPARWHHIAEAAKRSSEKLDTLKGICKGILPRDEGALVVFGSLARQEYTTGSDLDWTVVIDARADSRHQEILKVLKPKLEEAKFGKPGPTDTFGGLVFSHDLIHAIGGDEDTNKNMTRRLLLLLESTSVEADEGNKVHSRVLKGVLGRYVEEDANFLATNRGSDKIPRFLLNDVVRFWRTMAVDYANKYRARAGQKWALRNIKLRMSRKLLFVSGFLMCISWALEEHKETEQERIVQKLIQHLQGWTQNPPLESLAAIVERYAPHLASDILGNYDEFLALLSDDDKRSALEDMSPEGAYSDGLFLRARSTAVHFDAALTKLLFESNDDITRLVKKYGVF
jgi:predicted nucleotidyltransferase